MPIAGDNLNRCYPLTGVNFSQRFSVVLHLCSLRLPCQIISSTAFLVVFLWIFFYIFFNLAKGGEIWKGGCSSWLVYKVDFSGWFPVDPWIMWSAASNRSIYSSLLAIAIASLVFCAAKALVQCGKENVATSLFERSLKHPQWRCRTPTKDPTASLRLKQHVQN